MASLTQKPISSDLVKRELNPMYSRVGYSLQGYDRKATAAAAIDLEVGAPIYGATPGDPGSVVQAAVAGDEAAIIGILTKNVTVASGAFEKCEVLVRGPVAINVDEIPTVDANADAWTLATLLATLFTLGIGATEESSTQKTQTT